MASPKSSQAKQNSPRLALDTILTLVSHKARWALLKELMKGKPLSVGELVRRTGVSKASVSKHVIYMRRCGVLNQGIGRLYELPERFRVPGENLLDFGAVVLRMNYLQEE